MSTRNVAERIEHVRKVLGSDLTIVGHHYQTDSVMRHVDLRGDSLELARKTAQADSRYIMFCGVYFMAESAALLAQNDQEVHLPVPTADCSMAQMAAAPDLERVMNALSRDGRKVIPLAYVNSTLGIKAVVGKHGGSVCTSANAKTMLEWALGEGDAVLFLPDMNLGLNTADSLGLPENERHILDLSLHTEETTRAQQARLLLWPGYCSIHTCFTAEMIATVRAAHPRAKIIVHPESTPEVVGASDGAGSTSYIIRYAEEAAPGSTLVIGTETNLVHRLARAHADRMTIVPLAESACTFMAETTEERLALALEALLAQQGDNLPSPYRVTIDQSMKAPGKAALERMLKACA